MMRVLSCILLALGVFLGATAFSAAPPRLDAEALALLRAACASLSALPGFTYTADVRVDKAYPTGEKIQLASRSTVSVLRPGKLNVDSQGDDRDFRIVCDGASLTFHDRANKYFVTVACPPDMDAVLDTVLQTFSQGFPFMDLLASQGCAGLADNLESARDVGLHLVEGGGQYRHLAFGARQYDWQLWLDQADGLTLPKKMVITDALRPAAPQYQAVMTSFSAQDAPDASLFTFTPPPGCDQVALDVWQPGLGRP